jgi:SepF-like predicted cell division protein (DUF552 family)
MVLTDEEAERYLNQIFIGQRLIYIDEKLFLFKQPDNYIKAQADLIYNSTYNDAVESGMLPVDELEEILEERHIISDKEQKELEGLKSQLYAQQILLGKTTKIQANQDRIKGIINRLKKEISGIESKKLSKLAMSAESKAAEEKALYLCWACTYVKINDDYKLYWKNFDDLLKEYNLELRNKILIKFLQFKAGVSTETIRFLARHSLWRIRYVTSQKVSDPLFGVPTSQYTNDMMNLAYWSNFYQNIYEMMPKDRPTDLIIEDDDALDAYMKSYYEERNREDIAERSKHQTQQNRGTLSAFDKEEVIVTRSNELYEDIKYDKPREAQRIKGRADIKKKAKRKR